MITNTILAVLRDTCGVERHEKVLLGFSGGPDSACLLDVLVKDLQNVCIAYFDHQLRLESKQEMEFANHISKKYQIDLILGKGDISTIAKNEKQSIETTARKYRYQFLKQSAIENDAKMIAVAHHADDQVETILMNILRGCGMQGLTGMSTIETHEFTKPIPVIRPMLDIYKKDILKYCEEKSIPYQVDDTNYGSEYSRNRLRNQVIPLLKTINPRVKESILRLHSVIQDEDELLENRTRDVILKVVNEEVTEKVEIDLPQFAQLHKSIQRRVLLEILRTSFSLEKDLQYNLVEEIRRFFLGEIASNEAEITTKIHVLKEGNTGWFFRDMNQLSSADDLSLKTNHGFFINKTPSTSVINRNWEIKISTKELKEFEKASLGRTDRYMAYFDLDRITFPIQLRRRNPGDRYAPLGMNGKSMKISDFMINKKLPRRLRKDYPLICDKKNILWIPGFQPADSAKITENTKAVVKMEVIKVG